METWIIFGQIFRVEIQLLQERRHKFLRIEFFKFFPIKFAAIDDAATAQVKEIRGDERRLGVVGEDVGVVALSGGNALALFDVFERAEKIAIGGGLFEEFLLGGGSHAFFEALDQVVALAFQKEPSVAHGFRVALVGGQSGDAGTKAALDVVLQTGTRVIAREIDVAGSEPGSVCGRNAGCGAPGWPESTGRSRASRLF